MSKLIAIRREDKSVWERRVPITPADAGELQSDSDLQIVVQSSENRCYSDQDFRDAGVEIRDSIGDADVVFGVKEIPLGAFEPGTAYVFFAHVIKGQTYNMPMLRKMMEFGCHLIDYEKIADAKRGRLIFFGRHAGLAGMLDTLWAFGQRLQNQKVANPFGRLRQAVDYGSLKDAVRGLSDVAKEIQNEGLPAEIEPLVIGISGYGNVSAGAQTILSHLPIVDIQPDELMSVFENNKHSPHHIYQVVFKEQDMVEACDPTKPFELQDYFNHPQGYRSKFSRYLPYLSILVNAIYWDERYPRLVTRDAVMRLFESQPQPRLRVIGDISCDIQGAIEVTVKATDPGDPVYVYDPLTGEVRCGFEGRGLAVMAVEILPTELPIESSIDFSSALKRFVPAIAKADFSMPFEQLEIPVEIKSALILHQGKLTPAYQYLSKFI